MVAYPIYKSNPLSDMEKVMGRRSFDSPLSFSNNPLSDMEKVMGRRSFDSPLSLSTSGGGGGFGINKIFGPSGGGNVGKQIPTGGRFPTGGVPSTWPTGGIGNPGDVADILDPLAEAVVPGYARKKEAAAQRDAQKEALGFQREMWSDIKGMQEPWLDVGEQALHDLYGRMGRGEYNVDIDRPEYGRLPFEQFGYEGITPTREYDQINMSREYDPLNIERGYDPLTMERDYRQLPVEKYQPGEWRPENLADDPGYQFRLQEGTKAIEGSAAARGGLLSGQTMKDLAEFGQGLASQEADRAYGRFADAERRRYGAERDYRGDIERERGFEYGTGRDYLSDLMGERAFKYGTGQDFLRNLADERSFKYGTGRDYLGDIERERGFKYGTGRDYQGDIERERGFKYGTGQDYLRNLSGERGFQYGVDQDYLRNVSAEQQNRYNRLAALARTGQVAGQSLGSQGLQAGAGMADTIGNIGEARGQSAMAIQQGILDLLGIGGRGLSMAGSIIGLGG